MEQLERRGIEARVFYPLPIHRTPFYLKMQLRNNVLPNTEWASAHVLSLPVHQNLSEEQMMFIAKETKAAVKQIV
jgi:dTDP-4-amino-4,6-dideoxygalactose transaminase